MRPGDESYRMQRPFQRIQSIGSGGKDKNGNPPRAAHESRIRVTILSARSDIGEGGDPPFDRCGGRALACRWLETSVGSASVFVGGGGSVRRLLTLHTYARRPIALLHRQVVVAPDGLHCHWVGDGLAGAAPADEVGRCVGHGVHLVGSSATPQVRPDVGRGIRAGKGAGCRRRQARGAARFDGEESGSKCGRCTLYGSAPIRRCTPSTGPPPRQCSPARRAGAESLRSVPGEAEISDPVGLATETRSDGFGPTVFAIFLFSAGVDKIPVGGCCDGCQVPAR